MIKELIARAIEQKNPFMSEDMIKLQIEFFFVAGKLTAEEREELLNMLNPPAQEPAEA